MQCLVMNPVRILLVAAAMAFGVDLARSADANPTVDTRPPFDQFLGSLKQDKGRYLLNEEWLSADDLRIVWERRDADRIKAGTNVNREAIAAATPVKFAHPDFSLNINLIKGELDYWAKLEDRRLSYAIDKRSMSSEQFAIVDRAMTEAVRDWEDACPQCGIRFEHQSRFDAAPSHRDVRFIVRLDREFRGFGYSFFPSTPVEQRFLVIGPQFFEPGVFSQAGTLRHQIGHMLGYRHEHISPEAPKGCFGGEEPTFITGAYDPKSVMHYYCGGAGTTEMKLSERDIVSHQLLYGFATVQVEIESKDIFKSVSQAIAVLDRVYDRVQYRPQKIDTAEACKAYIRDLGLLEAVPPRPEDQAFVDGRACAAFVPLAKVIAGVTQLPVLAFTRSTDFASGSFFNTDRQAFRAYEELSARVAPLDFKSEWRPTGDAKGTRIFNYELEWARYRANIPVAGWEMSAVRAALERLARTDPGIRVSVDDAIGRSQSLRQSVKPNAVVFRNPVFEQESICLPASGTFGPYPMLLDGGPEDSDFVKANIAGAEIPQLACDFKDTEASCTGCNDCSDPKCNLCRQCNQRDATALVVEETIDREALKFPAAAAGAGPTCGWKPYHPKHHGTLMAQIVAGRNKFVGFMPGLDVQVVSPGASHTVAQFEKDLYEKYRPEAQRPGVAILTSQLCNTSVDLDDFFPTYPNGLSPCEVMGEVHAASEAARVDLLGRNPTTKRIRNSTKWLWVVAIGQPNGVEKVNDPPAPSTFSEASIASPIVLARESHVMLVSACEKCSVRREAVSDRRVWVRAHRGEGAFRPHVIAPGGVDHLKNQGGQWVGGIPGFGLNNEPVRSYGTSQATAYVGGLATKMLSCYRNHYQTMSTLKEAIQFTSMPVLPDAGGRDLVATGLVDVGLALRHPKFVYLQNKGEGDKQFTRVSPEHFKWCSHAIKFRTSGGGHEEISAEAIRRIVRMPVGGVERFVVYHRPVSATDGGVFKDGAIARSQLFAGVEGPQLFSSDGQVKKISDIQDLLLFNDPGVAPCP